MAAGQVFRAGCLAKHSCSQLLLFAFHFVVYNLLMKFFEVELCFVVVVLLHRYSVCEERQGTVMASRGTFI